MFSTADGLTACETVGLVFEGWAALILSTTYERFAFIIVGVVKSSLFISNLHMHTARSKPHKRVFEGLKFECHSKRAILGFTVPIGIWFDDG